MAQAYAQAGLSPLGVQALPAGHRATPPEHVAVQQEPIDLRKKLADLIEKFETAEDSSGTNREKAERDIDYYDGKQLTTEEHKALTKRGQPPHVDNRIKRKIRYLQGLEQNQRTDPRALPRTPKHEDDAHAVTDALRFVCESNRYDQIRSKSWKDILSAGWGGVEVVAEPVDTQPNPRIRLRRCPWDRMFWDPYSSAEDFSDASYLGVVLWMDRDEAILRYGDGAEKVFDETISGSQVGGTYDDKPKLTTWVSYEKRQRIRVVQMYHVGDDGIWEFCEYTKGGFLNYGPSPWKDDEGKPEHPYAWRSANVDRDNNRYGEIRDMIDLQDAMNKRKSKLLHLVSVRQTYATESAFAGGFTVDKMRQETSKPDGHIALAHGTKFGEQFGVIQTDDLAQGQVLLLQQDIASLDLQGPNASMQGKDPRQQSGRAILAQQQGGSLEANPTFDNLRDMDHEAYRKIWRRIRQFWQAEEWIRITDDEKNLRWVGINTPQMQPMMDPMTGQPAMDPSGQPMGQPAVDPMTGQPVIQNQVAELEIDIIVDDAPHVGTLQQEEFQALMEGSKAGLPIPPKVLLKASSFRNKAELLEELDKAEKAQQGQPNPEMAKMQAQAELEKAKAMAQVEARTAMAQADLQAKAQEHAQQMQFERDKFELEMQMLERKGQIELAIRAHQAQNRPEVMTRQ